MIKFRCAQCQQKMALPEAAALKRAKCPKCGGVNVVPAANVEDPAAGVQARASVPAAVPVEGRRIPAPVPKPGTVRAVSMAVPGAASGGAAAKAQAAPAAPAKEVDEDEEFMRRRKAGDATPEDLYDLKDEPMPAQTRVIAPTPAQAEGTKGQAAGSAATPYVSPFLRPIPGQSLNYATSQTDLLKHSDAKWLQTMRNGFGILALVIGVSILVGFVLRITSAAVSPALYFTGLMVLELGQSFAVWLIASPEPERNEKLLDYMVRWTARGLAVSAAIGAMLLSIGFVADQVMLLPTGFTMIMATALEQLTVLMIGRGLAKRMPDESLATQCSVVLWGFLATAATFFVSIVMGVMMRSLALAAGVCVAWVALVVFGVWYERLVFKFRTAF